MTTATPGADRHTDPAAPAPAPAAVVPHETDEDVAKRLSHEINVTGRARRAPAPSYVPSPIKQGLDPERLKLLRKRQRDKARVVKDAAKAKAKARRAAAEAKRKKRKDARRATRQNANGAAERPKKAKKARVDEEDVTLAELLCADPLLKAEPLKEEPDPSADDDDVVDPDTPEPRQPDLDARRPTNREPSPPDTAVSGGDTAVSPDTAVDYGVLADDEDWRSTLPRREMPPPEGYSAGTLVWAFLRGARKHRKDRGGDTAVSGDTAGGGDAACDADLGPGTWWPGRVWKLRNARSAAKLWRDRGAPPSKPRALVRCFGDGSFVWCAPNELARYAGDATLRDARTAELFAAAARGCARRDWSATGGIRVYAQNVRKALLEADEAEIMNWDTPPWTDSDDAYSDADDDRGRLSYRGPDGPNPSGRGRRGPREREAATDDADHHDGSPKDGLTPDWIIDAGCRMFGLNVPTVQEPIVKGLLDPCTNDKRDPNIPAEKTYDKRQDGLKQENPWKGYHVILNPSYESQVQWRFINRAINEVEWGFCPGILLVCRNSTDTSYFQRLLPFPRIFLRRDAVRFKDYTHTPIGFGIAVFCLVSPIVTPEEKMATYSRFYNEFRHAGEFNIPFDGEFLKDVRFKELTDRLHVEAALKYRDSWVACDECDRWREVPPTQSLAEVGAKDTWRCRDAYPQLGCDAPLTGREYKAFSVATKGQATPLLAAKRGTDILGYDDADEEDEEGEGVVLALPCPEVEEDEPAKEEVVEKYEPDEEEVMEDEDERRDDGDPWLDEATMRRGRKRFTLFEESFRKSSKLRGAAGTPSSQHKIGCRCALTRCREKRAKEMELLTQMPHELLSRPEWMGVQDAMREAGELSQFEKERLERIRRNREKLGELMHSKEDVAAVALQRVAEASAARNASRRILHAAEERHRRATAVAAATLVRSSKAAAAARVAEAEVATAEASVASALGEVRRARLVASRLERAAVERNKECAVAEAALESDKKEEEEEDEGDN